MNNVKPGKILVDNEGNLYLVKKRKYSCTECCFSYTKTGVICEKVLIKRFNHTTCFLNIDAVFEKLKGGI